MTALRLALVKGSMSLILVSAILALMVSFGRVDWPDSNNAAQTSTIPTEQTCRC